MIIYPILSWKFWNYRKDWIHISKSCKIVKKKKINESYHCHLLLPYLLIFFSWNLNALFSRKKTILLPKLYVHLALSIKYFDIPNWNTRAYYISWITASKNFDTEVWTDFKTRLAKTMFLSRQTASMEKIDLDWVYYARNRKSWIDEINLLVCSWNFARIRSSKIFTGVLWNFESKH